MQLRMLSMVVAGAAIIAACSGPGATPAPAATTTAEPTVQATAPATAPATATRIEVSLTDALRIEPATMKVPVGVPVTFVVTNAGVLDHEFYLGDEQAQAAHEAEMAMGGMTHDEPEGIGVKPGQTKELTYTFTATGETFAGCHVPGHYAAGMKAVITVE